MCGPMNGHFVLELGAHFRNMISQFVVVKGTHHEQANRLCAAVGGQELVIQGFQMLFDCTRLTSFKLVLMSKLRELQKTG